MFVFDLLVAGGRLIYVGCGASGRLAACDATELNCTFGLPLHQALALISGGAAEALMTIESEFEEDASSVPDLLLMDPNASDVVIGISASGSAYFVQSALALARSRGCYTVLLSAQERASVPVDQHIGLMTGAELVTGSTRMKAGTATKKILNALTTSAMILNGKVAGTFMIDLACVNEKLVARAVRIIQTLHGVTAEDARDVLERNEMRLSAALASLALA